MQNASLTGVCKDNESEEEQAGHDLGELQIRK